MNAIALSLALVLLAPQDVQIPAARGHLNDFAGVVDAARAARIERIAEYVRSQSRGEIAIVTMRDIRGREANDIALRIGREWGVGANAPVGDRARNAGVVILLVPKETASDGRGQVAVEVGQGAEGFIPDGVAGDIWRSTIPQLRGAQYGEALERITYAVAERYAREFGFSMDSLAAFAPPRPIQGTRRGSEPRNVSFPVALIMIVVFIVIIGALSRNNRGGRGGGSGLGSALPWIILNQMSRRGGRSSSWGGGGFGGFGGGGGGGGGFGGFGGGGGFSGGGSHGSW